MKKVAAMMVVFLMMFVSIGHAKEPKEQVTIPSLEDMQRQQDKDLETKRQLEEKYSNMLMRDTLYSELLESLNVRAGMIHERKRMLTIKGVKRALEKARKKQEKKK